MKDLVLAITGASGSAYAIRLLQVLIEAGRQVHLVISPAGEQVLQHELGLSIDPRRFSIDQLLPTTAQETDSQPGQVAFHDYRDFSAGIASGSFRTDGMVICPCSMGTLAAVSQGLSQNLIQRAADVHLKERRKLVVVPRETPLGSIQLSNMKILADAGVVILPAMPGFYNQPQSINDLVDFVVSRICDQLGVPQDLTKRWGKPKN
ncbi:MAG: UbiX family flavin prenyltransferase [Planctomycetota bacterium]|nr:UbiX family flavin prenyltransferase [Planctomycetota bacterium]MDA1165300.1 UbiX family flavin prenyltransferase [Planctomycetota bacterium]